MYVTIPPTFFRRSGAVQAPSAVVGTATDHGIAAFKERVLGCVSSGRVEEDLRRKEVVQEI